MDVVFVIRKKAGDRFVCKSSRNQKWQMFSESDRSCSRAIARYGWKKPFCFLRRGI